MLKEFKEFAMKGNVVDMAIGIIIGGAFGKIVSSLVADVLMPPIGILLGGLDFSSLAITLKPAEGAVAAVTVRYGLFINTVIDFIIVAFCIFMVIRGMNAMRRKQDAPTAVAAPTTKECTECAMVIPIKAKKCGYCHAAQAK
jgi:large conductance mechanosensitive channel